MAGPDTLDFSLRRFVLPMLFVLGLFAALWWRRPSSDPPPPVSIAAEAKHHLEGSVFGTTWSVTWIGKDSPEMLRPAVMAALQSVDAQMSTYRDDSELGRLNQSRITESQPISATLHHVLSAAFAMAERTEGAFDPTIGPLVNAWGFGPTTITAPPSDEALLSARTRVGWQKLEILPNAVRKTQPDLYIDLSAVAKGYAVDAVAEALETVDIFQYLVEIGGEVRTRGRAVKDRPWRLGIERPDGSADIFEVVALSDQALATSGNYRQSVRVDGQIITHILDGSTKAPITHRLGSVSVLRDTCLQADAWATALYVLGEKEGLALAEAAEVPALFLTIEGNEVRRITTSHWPASTLSTGERTVK